VTIIGTRPEIIKMSRLIPLLDEKFEHTFIFSDQHYSENMVDIFFKELGVRKADYFLNAKSSEYSDLIPPMVKKLARVDPAYVLVYGDTNSTLAAALAAKRLNKKVIHVEAGLRSFDRRMPEELNRVLTDHISDFLFTPTIYTNNLLRREGISNNVFIVGNTIVDAVLTYLPKVDKSDVLEKLNLSPGGYFLMTLHRQELVDNPKDFKEVIRTLGEIDRKIIFPIHPRTKKRLSEYNLILPKNVVTTPPLGYFDFLKLLKESEVIMTDSGGLQEEAITLKTPCLTLRQFTERMETVEMGANFLVGYDGKKIKNGLSQILDGDLKNRIKKMKNPYGDGTTSQKIVDALS
jgi:UDP-N-acetylglucosamine 2-epimerase (non-hydrolysing)